ncbi:MAG: aldo/keto reductase [Candidatus Poribacteria bacterium]
MEYRRLGRTELKVSVIGFGTIKFPQVDADEANKALNRALDLGINYIDTARAYQDSESKIGAAIKDRRDEYIIATKSVTRDAEGARKDLETSLKELGIEYVDVWKMHSVSDGEIFKQVMAPGGSLDAAKKAKAEGKIKHIGLSMHRDLRTMKEAINSDEFEVILLPNSIINQEDVEEEVIPMAKEHDMGIVVMKPFSDGLLISEMPAEERQRADYDPIARGSLRFVASNENISVVIPGMRNVKEVEENAAVGDMTKLLNDDELKALLSDIGKLGREFRYGQKCLMRCGYCEDVCPENIEISKVYRAVVMTTNYPDNLKSMGAELYNSLEIKPSACTACQKCLEVCPANLSIIEQMRTAVSMFS